MSSLLSSNTFDSNTAIPSLAGKVYLVTGGTAGIGFGIAAHILQHNPAKLYILSNKSEHLDEAHSALAKYGDTSVVEKVECDLQSLSQTDKVAQDLASKLPRLDALVLNAGLGVGAFELTPEDGLESHMQVNVIAQHILARRLFPVLSKTDGSRLCMQSSDLHRTAPSSDLQIDSVAGINRDVGGNALYAQTKLAQILMARAMSRRRAALGASGKAPVILTTHPGGVATDQNWQAEDAYGMVAAVGLRVIRPFMKDPVDQGCRPMLFAATSPDIWEDGVGDGAYIVPDRKVTDPSSQAQDEELQEKVWKFVEELLHEKVGLDVVV